MIYKVSTKIKRERMNTLDQKNDRPSENIIFQRWFFASKTLDIDFENYITNEYLRFNNWYWKPNPTLEFRETNIVDNFQGKSNNLEIIKKLKEFIHLLQDE